MAIVYIEARPKCQTADAPVTDYVVEDHADHVLGSFLTQRMQFIGPKRTATLHTLPASAT